MKKCSLFCLFYFVLCDCHYLTILLNLVTLVVIFDSEAGDTHVILYFVIFNFVIDRKQVSITIKLKIINFNFTNTSGVGILFYYFCQNEFLCLYHA